MKNFLLKAYTKAQILREDHGQDLIEYALIAALLALAALTTMNNLAAGINGVFTRVVAALAAAPGGGGA
jgi:pilus assembly protein Flp/PilA